MPLNGIFPYGIVKKTSKPILVILPYSTPEEMAEAIEIIPRFQNGGVPVFPSIERGALALKNALDYYRLKSRDINIRG